MNDDKFLDDDIDSCPDNTTLGKNTNVEGGKVDAVETGEKSSEDSDTV